MKKNLNFEFEEFFFQIRCTDFKSSTNPHGFFSVFFFKISGLDEAVD